MNPSFPARIVLPLVLAIAAPLGAAAGAPTGLRKVRDLIVYRDDAFYSAFPSVVRRPDGELIVAFRRAPERRRLGERAVSHTDPNSQLVLVRSDDQGRTWTREPELLYAHPFGGLQDPCMVALRDGTILCTTYGWALLPRAFAATLTNTLRHDVFGFLGGALLRSRDGGRSWEGPFRPPHVPADTTLDVFGQPVAAYNRGAMCQGRDGRLYWAVAANASLEPRRTEVHLLVSDDQGRSWRYGGPVAADPQISFNEASLYETPRGELVAFLRTAGFGDRTVMARSGPRGARFAPWQDAGFVGHPHHAVRLPDRRVLLVYGYRHKPFGIRARVLDPECANPSGAPEMVLREDGGNADLGYPWATRLSGNRLLVVYYFNQGDGPRYIAGTILEIER